MSVFSKADLVAEVTDKCPEGTTKASVERVLAALQESIMEHVAKGEDVRLTGFVNFEPAVRAARTMRNPRTGEDLQVPETKVVRLRAGKKFRDLVAGKEAA